MPPPPRGNATTSSWPSPRSCRPARSRPSTSQPSPRPPSGRPASSSGGLLFSSASALSQAGRNEGVIAKNERGQPGARRANAVPRRATSRRHNVLGRAFACGEESTASATDRTTRRGQRRADEVHHLLTGEGALLPAVGARGLAHGRGLAVVRARPRAAAVATAGATTGATAAAGHAAGRGVARAGAGEARAHRALAQERARAAAGRRPRLAHRAAQRVGIESAGSTRRRGAASPARRAATAAPSTSTRPTPARVGGADQAASFVRRTTRAAAVGVEVTRDDALRKALWKRRAALEQVARRRTRGGRFHDLVFMGAGARARKQEKGEERLVQHERNVPSDCCDPKPRQSRGEPVSSPE